MNNVKILCLSQSKLYLKIIGIPYLLENTNIPITTDVVKKIIKNNHIFNNIAIALKLRVIKASLKLDIAIIWLNIWDIQSKSKVRGLINRCFNVGSYIMIIWRANINPEILQCKNCWKWDHVTFSCRIQGFRCVKCNGPHKTEHHWHFAWCCKANKKLTFLGWKQNRVNLVHIHSSFLTTKAIIKPTHTDILSESIASIKSSIQESTRSFAKAENNQFIQL